jgi:hypothetical protein
VGAAFPGGSRGAYANSLGVCGDDGAGKEFVLVAGDDVVDGAGHLCGSEAGEPDDSRVRQAFNNGKFPKVLVQGDENPPFRVGRSENCRITGILRPCSRPDSVVTEIAEELAEPLPRHRNQERWPASGSQSGGKEFYPFMTRQPGGVDQTGLDILGFQPWVSLKDGFRGVAGGKHVKNVFHGQTPAPDDRLACEDFRIAGDSLEKLVLVHGEKRRRKTQDFKTQDFKTQDFKTQDFKTQDFKTQDFKTQDARRKTQEKRGRCFGCLRLGVSVFAYALLRPCQFGFADFPSSLALTVHSVGVLWLPAARWFGG